MKKTLLIFASLFLFIVASAQTSHSVTVGSGMTFTPNQLTIISGDNITFTSDGGTHDVNFSTNSITGDSFDNPTDIEYLPIQGAGFMGTITFDVPGTYNYDCTVYGHASMGMVGQVVVNASVSNTVVDVIVGSPDHTTLEAAVIAAGLAGTLSGDGPFTVFAPTDAAFALLPEGTVADLLADPTGALTSILTHHVYGGTALSTDLSDGMMVTTLAGTSLTVSITDEGVYIDNAMVTVANIETDNGVVHVIDAVLIPSNLSIDESLSIENGQYLYSIDLLGKRIKRTTLNKIIFDIYSSGNVVKRFSNK